jgi:hypothetical protein
MARWVGQCEELCRLLTEALRRYTMATAKLHADDTPIPVLAPGNKKTKTGRLWAYVRDDRRSGSSGLAAVWFAYSPDRKGIHLLAGSCKLNNINPRAYLEYVFTHIAFTGPTASTNCCPGTSRRTCCQRAPITPRRPRTDG